MKISCIGDLYLKANLKLNTLLLLMLKWWKVIANLAVQFCVTCWCAITFKGRGCDLASDRQKKNRTKIQNIENCQCKIPSIKYSNSNLRKTHYSICSRKLPPTICKRSSRNVLWSNTAYRSAHDLLKIKMYRIIHQLELFFKFTISFIQE